MNGEMTPTTTKVTTTTPVTSSTSPDPNTSKNNSQKQQNSSSNNNNNPDNSKNNTEQSTSAPVVQANSTTAAQQAALSAAGAQNALQLPEADAIKMFVGQLPKHWDEQDVRKIFESFGSIYSLNVLRDREHGVSRGCAFITFHQRQSALDAQNALHNTKILPGVSKKKTIVVDEKISLD